jgi:hypothetical protein
LTLQIYSSDVENITDHTGNTPDDETTYDNEVTVRNVEYSDSANDSIIYDSNNYYCTVCNNVDHLLMLKCDKCATWLHFECTRIPAYHLSPRSSPFKDVLQMLQLYQYRL